MATRAYNLLLRGWNEIPEIIGSSAIALVGVGFGTYAMIRYPGEKRRYKRQFVVMRPDDPRTQFILD